MCTYRSTRDGQLNLALGSTHQLPKLLADALQQAQSVVECQGVEEVLHGFPLVARCSGVLLQLGDDGGLVLDAEGRCLHDRSQLGVLVVDIVECGYGFGGAVQS